MLGQTTKRFFALKFRFFLWNSSKTM